MVIGVATEVVVGVAVRVEVRAVRTPGVATPDELRLLRTSLSLTQVRFGDLVGVHGLTVSRWERGTLAPSGAVLQVLSAVRDALAVDPELPETLRAAGDDPVRQLTVILATLHPDAAVAGVTSREEAERLLRGGG